MVQVEHVLLLILPPKGSSRCVLHDGSAFLAYPVNADALVHCRLPVPKKVGSCRRRAAGVSTGAWWMHKEGPQDSLECGHLVPSPSSRIMTLYVYYFSIASF